MIKKILILILAISVLSGCTISKKTVNYEPLEYETLDTLLVLPSQNDEINFPYRATSTIKTDLVHTSLDVHFDWEKKWLIGKASITLKPHFYPTSTIELDAVGFQINSITKDKKPVKYDYNGKVITIFLDKKYTNEESIVLDLDYIAKPMEQENGVDGVAISSDQGLYFINSDGKDPEKPQQIWTQGETESNSKWFPTIDKPNQRCTEDIKITVQNRYTTLSNGILQESIDNKDGTRTDHWVMDKPHAPYLVMMAIGEYATVKEKWNDIDIEYLVEPEYKDDAKDIFPYTTEMLQFFSDKLGVVYPWQKYSQVVVREYVSGAMENTTAVIFGDYVQQHKGDLYGAPNETVVAHEMFHHWFGDYVTTESWANLTLNEGFANYGEYLWLEHKYGKEVADKHLYDDLLGYLQEASYSKKHDLIDFHYSSKGSMFDRHTYNKGGTILHMLRNYVGDKAFFAALKEYLTSNAYSPVEVHNLRLSFEKITGEDLNWFWNQWFFDKGHPELEVKYSYDEEKHQAIVDVEQKQNPETDRAVFVLPLDLDIYYKGGRIEHKPATIDKRKQTFSFNSLEKPALMTLDPARCLVGEINDNKSYDEMFYQFFHSNAFLDKWEALQKFAYSSKSKKNELLLAALSDKNSEIRAFAISSISPTDEATEIISNLAINDNDYKVRKESIIYLGKTRKNEFVKTIKATMQNEKSNEVIGAALKTLSSFNLDEAISVAESIETTKSSSLLHAIGALYLENRKVSKLSFFENNWLKLKQQDAIEFMQQYAALSLQTGDRDLLISNMEKLKNIATNMKMPLYNRIGAGTGIYIGINAGGMPADIVSILKSYMKTVKEKETNMHVQRIYESF